MLKFIIVLGIAIEQYVLYRIAFSLGIKSEQMARLRRLNMLKRLLNGKV